MAPNKDIKRNIVFDKGMIYFLKYSYLEDILKKAFSSANKEWDENWLNNYIINHFDGNYVKMVESIHKEGYIKSEVLKTRLLHNEIGYYNQKGLDSKVLVLEHTRFKHHDYRPIMQDGFAIYDMAKFDLLDYWPNSYNTAYVLKESEEGNVKPIMICLSGKAHKKYWKHRRKIDEREKKKHKKSTIEEFNLETFEWEEKPFSEIYEDLNNKKTRY